MIMAYQSTRLYVFFHWLISVDLTTFLLLVSRIALLIKKHHDNFKQCKSNYFYTITNEYNNNNHNDKNDSNNNN